MAIVDISDRRLHNRKVDEFVGVCRVLAAKRKLEEVDVIVLDRWLDESRSLGDAPLTRDVFEAVDAAVLGRFAAPDLERLHATIRSFVGGKEAAPTGPTSLPLSDPPPPITFQGQRYCFTGKFEYGTRRECEEAVRQRGASVGDVSSLTNVLVIGSGLSASWRHSSYGRKIVSAVEHNDRDASICIVTEEHWRKQLAAASITGPLQKPLRAKKPDVADQMNELWKSYDRREIDKQEYQRRAAEISPESQLYIPDTRRILRDIYMQRAEARRSKIAKLRAVPTRMSGTWQAKDVLFWVTLVAVFLIGFLWISTRMNREDGPEVASSSVGLIDQDSDRT